MTRLLDTSRSDEIAPIQLIVIGFEGDHLHGQIRAELQQLRDDHTVRLVGLVAVRKDASGATTVIEETDLTTELADLFARLGGGMLGTTIDTYDGPPTGASVFGYTEADVRRLARGLPPNTAIAFAMFEHRWALRLKEAIVDARGFVTHDGLVGPTTLLALGEELGLSSQSRSA